MTAMSEPPAPALADVRRRIDELDTELVVLLARRQRLVDEITAYKHEHHLGVVDRHREDEMLAAIAETAEEHGLDPRVAQQVLRAVIDGFTLLEVEELGPDV
jgi:isochorismate pyruvate lyase